MIRKVSRRAAALAASALLASSASAAGLEAVAALPPALGAPPVAASASAAALAGVSWSAAAAPAAAAVAVSAAAAAPVAAEAATSPVAASAAAPAASSARAALQAGAAFDGAAARAALESAIGPDYGVRVLTRRQDGRDRLVVLLGESHLKSPAAAELGRSVIAAFKTYGLEGYVNHSAAAKKHSEETAAHRKRMAETQPEKYGEGSTIDEASLLVMLREVQLLALREKIESLPAEERGRLLASAAAAAQAGTPRAVAVVAGDGTVVLDAAGLRDLILALDAGDFARVESAVLPREFDLEEGHRPGLAENAALRYSGFVSFALRAAGVAALTGLASLAYSPLHWVALAAALPFAYLVLDARASQPLLDGPLGVLFPFSTGLTRGRDRTMSRNIARLSASADGADPVLAIVGERHLAGISRRLTRAHGFVAADLDALSPR